MKILLYFLLFVTFHSFGQTNFDYTIQTKPKTIIGFEGLHSFAIAERKGKILIIGGRLDGIHARQPFNSFPQKKNNTDIILIDLELNSVKKTTINLLPTALKEQLQGTNFNFYQDEDTLYITGGYAYSETVKDHTTFPYLTSVSISKLIQAIENQTAIDSCFKQIKNEVFAVTGAQLGKIGDTFYLVGGHRFEGRYNPMDRPTFVQTYVNGIRKFKINNSGEQLSFGNYEQWTDEFQLHRRDFNLIPHVFGPNEEFGYIISSGVFQKNADKPYLYPIEIKSSGFEPKMNFYQYLSNYHSAHASFYDSKNKVNHTVYFGGISQYTFEEGKLNSDEEVPFVKTISRLTRDINGNYSEYAFDTKMPEFVGSSTDFIPVHTNVFSHHSIIDLASLDKDSNLVGYIVGGLHSTTPNPFSNDVTDLTSSSNIIYEVWLNKDKNADAQAIDGTSKFDAKSLPIVKSKQFLFEFIVPERGDVELFVTDKNGKIVLETFYKKVKTGKKKLQFSKEHTLPKGEYVFNFIYNEIFFDSEIIKVKD
jgi:hypothetical protein